MKQQVTAADKLEAAMTRLLDGNPIHTTTDLLKENLYKEAQVSRATMNRNRDILARWDEAVRNKLAGMSHRPIEACVTHDKQIDDLSMALSDARRQLGEAQRSIRASATVIAALHAENVHLQQALRARQRAKVTELHPRDWPGQQ